MCEARSGRIGAVAKHQPHAPVSDLGQFAQIDGVSVNGCIVYLEISRMEDHSLRGVYGHANAVSYAMGRSDGFYLKITAQLKAFTGVNDLQIADYIVFFKLISDKSDGESGAVHRNFYVSQKIRYGAYMVFMTVCQHQTFDLVAVCYEIAEIRNDHIDAEHFVIWEAHSAIDDHYLIVVFQEGHVLTDLIETSDRNYLEGWQLPVFLGFSHLFPFFLNTPDRPVRACPVHINIYFTTKFTSLPGTAMTFMMVLPSVSSFTFSLSRAIFSSSALSISLDTTILSLSLPLI